MITHGSSRFGGLSFADNDIKLAAPNYDIYAQNTAALANKWQANKAGAEQTVDFIEQQNVLGVDKGIKDNASNKFVDAIKPYVETGRYEDATYALDGAVRDFQKDKGFGLAVNNYKAYSEWSQKQRDFVGWSEDERDAYIVAESSKYKGVKTHKDGTVSGSFQGRDMGEFMNPSEELVKILKEWKPDATFEELKTTIAGVGALQSTSTANKVDRLLETKGNNVSAMIAYATNYINRNKEMKHFMDTKRTIIEHQHPARTANDFKNNVNNSTYNIQLFGKRLDALNKDKKALAKFNDDYKMLDEEDKPLSDKASLEVFTTTEHLRMLGANKVIGSIWGTKWSDASPSAQHRYYELTTEAYSKAIDPETGVDVQAIQEKMAQFGKENLTEEEVLIVDGMLHNKIMVNAELEIYKADQAYNAMLPFAGKEQSLKLNHWEDKGIAASEDALRKKLEDAAYLPLASYMTTMVDTEAYNAVTKEGVKGYKALSEKSLVSANERQSEIFAIFRKFNDEINAHNSQEGAEQIPPLDVPARHIGVENKDEIYKLIELSPSQLTALRGQPSLYDQYKVAKRSFYNDFENHINTQAVIKRAEAYSLEKNKESFAPEKLRELKEESYKRNIVKYRQDRRGDSADRGYYDEDETPTLTPFQQRSLELDIENDIFNYKSKFDKDVAEYIKEQVVNNNSTVITDFSGIYETGNESEVKEFANMTQGLIQGVMPAIKGKGTYKVITKDNTYGDQYGATLDKGMWSRADDINAMKLQSVHRSSLDGHPVYRFRASMRAKGFFAENGDLSDDEVIIEYVDELGQMNQLLSTTFNGLSDGKFITDPMAMNGLAIMKEMIRGDGKTELKDIQNAVTNSGQSPVVFHLPTGRSINVGTVKLETGVNKDGTNNKNFNTYRFIPADGSKELTKSYSNFIEFGTAINDMYESAVTKR